MVLKPLPGTPHYPLELLYPLFPGIFFSPSIFSLPRKTLKKKNEGSLILWRPKLANFFHETSSQRAASGVAQIPKSIIWKHTKAHTQIQHPPPNSPCFFFFLTGRGKKPYHTLNCKSIRDVYLDRIRYKQIKIKKNTSKTQPPQNRHKPLRYDKDFCQFCK